MSNPKSATVFQLDLETLGLSNNNAVVAQVGIDVVVLTNVDGKIISSPPECIKSDLCISLSVVDQLKAGRTIDDAVIEWWMNQPREASSTVFGCHTLYKDAARDIALFINANFDKTNPDKMFLMSSDISLDVGNYRGILESNNLPIYFQYNRFPCFRTIREIYGKDNIPKDLAGGVKHNALADAKWQNAALLHMLNDTSNPACNGIRRLLGID